MRRNGTTRVTARTVGCMDPRSVVDLAGARWGIEIDPPGSLGSTGGMRGADLLSAISRALRGGWCVSVFRIDGQERWQGPVQSVKLRSEAEAQARAEAIAASITDGTWRGRDGGR